MAYLSCLHCGDPLRHGRLYCSTRCKGLHERVVIRATCAICGTEFEHICSRANKAKYCSRTCYYRSLTHKGTIETVCDWCGKPIRKAPSHIFTNNFCCIRCRNLFRSRATNGVEYARSLEDWSRCSRCGWDENPAILVCHHIDRNDKNNHPANRQVLCWNCHMLDHFLIQDGPFTARNGS